VHPYLHSQLAMERHWDMVNQASRERLARQALAGQRGTEAQPTRRVRLGIRFPIRVRTRVA
jgi:hypothetical protein